MTGADRPIGPAAPVGEDDLQAYLDNRLAGSRREAVAAYLAAEPEVAARLDLERRQAEALRAALAGKFAEPIPARLRVDNIRAGRRMTLHRGLRQAAAVLVVLLAGGIAGWFAHGALAPNDNLPAGGSTAALTRDAVGAYRIYVSEMRHPVEVAAAEEEHLVRWLSKRLGRPLQAPALGTFGFHLIGGRLLPARDQTGADVAAAQFMYEHADGRRLTLYLRVGAGAETAFRFQQNGDAATFAWVDQGCGFALTAPGDRATLLPIAEAVYQAYDGAWGAEPAGG